MIKTLKDVFSFPAILESDQNAVLEVDVQIKWMLYYTWHNCILADHKKHFHAKTTIEWDGVPQHISCGQEYRSRACGTGGGCSLTLSDWMNALYVLFVGR